MNNISEDIEILEDFIYELKSFGLTKDTLEVSQAIENLIKAYKEKEIETNNDKEMIAKLSFELDKYQEKSREDEAVIEEMANEIFIEHNPHFNTNKEVIEYFRNKVKENKNDGN